jgi:predicted glycosyltransferase
VNIFFNISHPAHVHFFKNIIKKLKLRKHHVLIASRKKEFTISLLEAYGLEHIVLTKKGNGAVGLGRELILQQYLLYKILKKHNIDIMLQIGGIFNAPIGRLLKIPSVAISDTENDSIGNAISFRLNKHVLLPTCFDHSTGKTWKNQVLYPGYHELSYLSPQHFHLTPTYQNKFLVRFVGWGAGHDIGEKWLSSDQKTEIVEILAKHGEVYISSEMELPENLKKYEFKKHPSEIHSFMIDCRLIVGESATMASEAACLGIPALFISNTGRGYTTELDHRYGLIKHFALTQWEQIIDTLENWAAADMSTQWQVKRKAMLDDKIEVCDWIVDFIENYPQSVDAARRNDFSRFTISCVE